MAKQTKKSPPAKKTAVQKKSAENNNTAEIILICLGVLGIILLISLWFNAAGIVGKGINLLFKGLFGCGAYLLPIVLIAAAICHFVIKDDSKSIYTSILFILICVFVHLTYIIDHSAYINQNIIKLWELGNGSVGGGVIGGIIAQLLKGLLDSIASTILIIALGMIDIILLFNVSVLSFFARFFSFIGRSIRDSFTSMRKTDDSPAEDDDKSDDLPDNLPDITLNLPERSPEPEEEISISNPLDDIQLKDDDYDSPEAHNQPTSEETDDDDLDEELSDNDIDKELEEGKEKPVREYVFPSPDLLDTPAPATKGEKMDQLRENAARLLEILQSFGVEAKITNVTRGSSVTRYEVVPAAGVKVNKITALDQDIAMRLPAENVRIEVLPGSVGIEASTGKSSAVYIREMIESSEFANHPSKVAAVLGRDIDGKVVVVDIAKMPHLLIAGATGSGKSVCINTIITSILYKSTPEEVRLVMVDPKVVELEMYNGIPHLLVPIVTDPRKAAGALCWAVNEMEERYKKFAETSVRNLSGYNQKIASSDEAKLPQIVIIIDELADLMMVAPGEVQDYICRLAQKARAAGIHLILATQRPSVDVITGLIKANIPSRFSFKVSSAIDSRTILDCGGAEKLIGKGDMLMMINGDNKLVRLQGAWVSDGDVERVTSFIKNNSDANYNTDVQKSIEGNTAGKKDVSETDDEVDELFDEAVDIAFELDQISTSMLQRRLKIGYARAGRLIDLMDKMQVISPYDGSNKPRTLRMTREQYYAARAASSEADIADDDDAPF